MNHKDYVNETPPPVVPGREFEPLLDSAEAAALLKIHPEDAAENGTARRGGCHPDRQVVAFSCLRA